MQKTFVKAAALSVLILISIAALAADAPTASKKTYAHHLSKQDITELADIVCRARHGVNHDKVNAWTEKPRDVKNAQATVVCQPHAVTDNYAVYYKADCRHGEKWECKASETRLHAKLDTQRIDIDIRGYQPEIAYSLIRRLDKYRLPKGDPVLTADTAQCALGKGPSKELLDITCDKKLIRLSYWCPQSSCPRIFWISGYFVPADVGGL